jgi:hypothetical protein
MAWTKEDKLVIFAALDTMAKGVRRIEQEEQQQKAIERASSSTPNASCSTPFICVIS